MITSATFENAKWYEEYLEKETFTNYNAPEKELAFFQRILFEEAGYQILNSQGNINPGVFVNHLKIDKKNDLEQTINLQVSITSKVSTIGYEIKQKRSSISENTATTEIKILTPDGVKQQIQSSFDTDGPLSPIKY